MSKDDSKKPVGVVQTQRRTWDKEVYMKKAIERELQLQAEEVEPLARKKPETRKADPNVIDLKVLKPAQARTQDLKLEETEGGFFCKTCGVQLKDSQSYLDHINGKKHLRAEGMSLRPERATVDDVRAKLSRPKADPVAEALAAERERKAQKQQELDQKRKEEEQRELEEKLRKKEKKMKKKKKQQDTAAAPVANPEQDFLATMGLPTGFGTSKK